MKSHCFAAVVLEFSVSGNLFVRGICVTVSQFGQSTGSNNFSLSMTKHPLLFRAILCWLNAIWLMVFASPALAKISVTGVDNGERKKIIAHLEASEQLCRDDPVQARILRRLIDTEITQALQALGYFNAEWELALEQDGKCWDLQLSLTPGEPLQIRQFDFQVLGEAAEDESFAPLINEPGLVEKGRFDNQRYERLKQQLQAKGLRYGYFDARFLSHQVSIYPAENSADISLIWDSGQRYRYGEVRSSQTVLDQRLFQRLLSVQAGDFYDLATVQKDQARLAERRYFSSIDIEPRLRERVDNRVPIVIETTPGPLSTYQYGVGYSTNTGPRLRADYSRHRVNASGHKAEVQSLFSPVLTTVNLNYHIPWRDPRTDSLRFDLGYVDEDTDSYDSERWETSLADHRKLTNGWDQIVSLSYSAEDAEVGQEKDRSSHLVPGLQWTKITADNPINPRWGSRLSMILLGSSDALLSDSSFLQLQLEGKWVQSLPAQFRLLARTALGVSLVDSIQDLPASRRFFTGGDNSIRGYDFQSVGPEENGEVIGGKNLAVASIELERPVFGNWSLAAFVDGGNAWSHGELNEVIGIGVGVRWRSPIGPVRLDLAFPQEDDEDSDFRVHFTMGPEF